MPLRRYNSSWQSHNLPLSPLRILLLFKTASRKIPIEKQALSRVPTVDAALGGEKKNITRAIMMSLFPHVCVHAPWLRTFVYENICLRQTRSEQFVSAAYTNICTSVVLPMSQISQNFRNGDECTSAAQLYSHRIAYFRT